MYDVYALWNMSSIPPLQRSRRHQKWRLRLGGTYNHVWKLLILYAHTAVYRAHAFSLVCFGISGYCLLLLLLYMDSYNLIIGWIRRACLYGSYSPSTLSPISTRVYQIPTYCILYNRLPIKYVPDRQCWKWIPHYVYRYYRAAYLRAEREKIVYIKTLF